MAGIVRRAGINFFRRLPQQHLFNLSIANQRQHTLVLRHYASEQEEKKNSEPVEEEAENKEQEAKAKACEEMTHEELVAECTKLNEVVKKDEEEYKVLKNKLAYALAEIENVRKISRKDVQNARDFALKDFGKDLVDVADNCERALSMFPEDCKAKGHALGGIFVGLEMTSNAMLKAFDKHGLGRIQIELNKTQFDPHLHEALFQQPVAGLTSGIIFSVVKSGWTINGRVLRAAQVGVSSDPPDAPAEETQA